MHCLLSPDLVPVPPKYAAAVNLMYQVLVFFLLMVTWVIFSGLIDPFHLGLGAISCALVTWMSSHMLFPDRSLGFGARLRQLFGFAGYFAWLLWQIVLANIHILRLAISPAGMKEVEPRVVRFRTRLQSDFARFVLAQSITLTPGTVTIKIIGNEFVIHAISGIAAAGLDGSMEKRIADILEPDNQAPQSPADDAAMEGGAT